jgi:hypothetical protein
MDIACASVLYFAKATAGRDAKVNVMEALADETAHGVLNYATNSMTTLPVIENSKK